MKDWIVEVLVGILLLIVGLFGIWYWLKEVVIFIKGAIGPILALVGALLLWIGYEDKKLEKELAEIEKELEKEETKEEAKQESKQ